jgi:hypothetical protein
VQYANGDPRPIRDVGTVLDDFFGVGVRPTVRLTGEWRSFQVSFGLGVGWHFVHASGRWRIKLGAGDRANNDLDNGGADWRGDDYAIYSFVENDNGAYSAFELALMYRLLGGRLGAGLLLQYTVLMQGKTDPDVEIEQQYGLADTPGVPAEWEGGYTAEEDDYEETLVRHLGAMNFLTIGLAADFRF